ncbi:MAG: signal peptidase II, partial [Acidobacteriota bacterium]
MRKDINYYLLIIILFGIDQLTKILIKTKIPIYSKIEVIPGFFNLSHIHNRGAIFGFFSQVDNSAVQILLALGSFIALGFVIYYFLHTPASSTWMKTSLSLILAGALGNLFDRIWRGYV